jgi:hypothetical protein
VTLIRTNVFEELSTSIIRVTRIGSSETSVLTKEPHGVTCQKKEFFIATVVKTSNLA